MAAERAVVLGLDGDCHSPIAALATIAGGKLTLKVAVGGRDGVPPVLSAEAGGPVGDADGVVKRVLADLERQGVSEALHG